MYVLVCLVDFEIFFEPFKEILALFDLFIGFSRCEFSSWWEQHFCSKAGSPGLNKIQKPEPDPDAFFIKSKPEDFCISTAVRFFPITR